MDGTQGLDSGDIYRTMTAILREVFEDDALEATPQLTADDVDGWDSISNIRFVLSVERAFGLRLTAGEVAGLQNIGDLARVIHQRI